MVENSGFETQNVDFDAAGRRSVELLDRTTARLVGVRPACEVVQGIGPRHFLHAGPPIEMDEIPGPMRGALIAGLMFEKEAHSVEQAEQIIDQGGLSISSCNDAGGAGPVAGVVTPTMPVVVAETSTGSLAFSPLNEGRGRVLRFGATDSATIERLSWMRDELAPLLNAAVSATERIDLTSFMAEALRRGDECHNRNVGVSAALLLRLAPPIIRTARTSDAAARALEWAGGNPQFFLSFAIAAAKAIAREAHNVPGSPIVTCVAANGIRIGIQVSGCGDEWFVTDSPLGNTKISDGYTIDDAQPALGDSFITEVVGLGACALSAAPAISSFLGTSQSDSENIVETMRRVCAGTSSRFVIPSGGYVGTPLGIDVSKVVSAATSPIVEYGLAHKRPGIGQIGAGLTEVPMAPFEQALDQLKRRRTKLVSCAGNAC